MSQDPLFYTMWGFYYTIIIIGGIHCSLHYVFIIIIANDPITATGNEVLSLGEETLESSASEGIYSVHQNTKLLFNSIII